MSIQRFLAATAALGLLGLTACGASTPSPAATPGGEGRILKVVAAFYPFQYVAERIAGGHAEVRSLTAPGAEPHDLELTPKEVAEIGEADLVIYEKTFQAAVDEAVEQSGNPHVLDTATVVPLQPASSGTSAPLDEEEAPNGLDPHVWLDPNNVATISDAVASRLTAIDPTHSSDYAANAAALRSDLAALDTSYRDGLATCQRTEFITTHAAFGYLARRYGLQQIGISGLSPDAEPSPRRIAAVQQEASRRHLTTIFYETLISPALAKSIAGDLGLKTDVLDPIEGITSDSRGRDYGAVMRTNLQALQTANSCS